MFSNKRFVVFSALLIVAGLILASCVPAQTAQPTPNVGIIVIYTFVAYQ